MRRKHHKVYGVIWDESTSSSTCERIGQGNCAAVSTKLPDNLQVIQNAMKRCLLQDNGEVNYYLDPSDSTLKEGGGASDLTGGDGQVMCEIPSFWHKYNYSGTKHQYLISKEQFSGATRHNAFHKNDAYVNNRYIGVYEGSLYDASISGMVDAADIITPLYASGDKLCSYSGEFPKVKEKRSDFRSAAAERGTGWRQQEFDLVSAIQLLYLVEYADLNSQSMIGMGRSELSGGTWTADSYIGQCGKSNGDGNVSNSVGGDTNNAYMTYRGIENIYGDVWPFIDGMNIGGPAGADNYKVHVCNNDAHFADDTWTNYTDLGIQISSNTGSFMKTLETISRGFLPDIGGSGADGSTYTCDLFYSEVGQRVIFQGGGATMGLSVGMFCFHASYLSSADSVGVCGRLSL